MMIRWLLALVLVVTPVVGSAQAAAPPIAFHISWIPNAASENIVQYLVSVDAAVPIVVPPTGCTATLCSVALTVPSFGLHSGSLVAQNLKFANDPASLQSSLPLVLPFTIGMVPSVITGGQVTN